VTPELVGLLGFAGLITVLCLGIPIGISLGLVGILGLSLLIGPEAAIIKAGVVSFEIASKYELGVLPLFLLMAHVCFAAGVSKDFFEVAARFIGHRRGGLALASIAGCAGFGAISGSSLATVATVGSAALPEMRRAGYAPGFAAGSLAAGGTLGALIPPSGALIVFGIIAEQSIGRLFAAAIIPGITQALFYMFAIAVVCRIKPGIGPRATRVSWGERLRGLGRIVDVLLLVLFVIGGMIAGWFTPTEAASIGVVVAFAISIWRKAFNAGVLKTALVKTLHTTGMLYLIIIGASLFATFVSVTGIPSYLSSLVISIGATPVIAILLMAALLVMLGAFMDGLALMLLTTPLLLPIATDLGYSPIWFGVFLVRAMEIAFIVPPLGLNAYVLQSLDRSIPLGTIFRGIVPFLVSDTLHLLVVVLVPGLALWLPKLVGV